MVRVKKINRRLPRPPAQPTLRSGGKNRQLPAPETIHRDISNRVKATPRTKRRRSRKKTNSPQEVQENASQTLNGQLKEQTLHTNKSSTPSRGEGCAGVFEGEKVSGRETIYPCVSSGDNTDNEDDDSQDFLEEGSSEDDMNARQRRRFLERAARVSSEDAGLVATDNASTSWRSKVYNDEVATRPDKVDGDDRRRRSHDLSRVSSRDSCDLNSLQASRPDKDDPVSRRRRSYDVSRISSREPSDLINHNGHRQASERSESRESDEPGRGRSSRRLSEESATCSDQLSERLAKRRAQRLEEAGDSSSLDSSFDSPRLQRDSLKVQRGGSRAGSERSEDGSLEGGHQTMITSDDPGRRRRSRIADDDGGYGAGRTPSAQAPSPMVHGDFRQMSRDGFGDSRDSFRDSCDSFRDSRRMSRGSRNSFMSLDNDDPAEGDEEDDGESDEISKLRRRRKLRRKQSEDSNSEVMRDQKRHGVDAVYDTLERRRRGRNAARWAEDRSSFQSIESNASFMSCEEWSGSGQWLSMEHRALSEDAAPETLSEHGPGRDDPAINNGDNSSDNNGNKIHISNGRSIESSSSSGEIYSIAPTSAALHENKTSTGIGNSHTNRLTHGASEDNASADVVHSQVNEVRYDELECDVIKLLPDVLSLS